MIYKRVIALALVLLPVSVCPALGAIRLGAPFGEHMVLQHDVPVAIWGTGCPGGDTVRVSIAGQSVTAKSDWAGRWMVQLAPIHAGGPYQLNIEIGGTGPLVPSSAANSSGGVEINDVLVGEIVFASRESEATAGATTSSSTITAVPGDGTSAAGAHPYAWIREYKYAERGGDEVQTDAGERWLVASPIVTSSGSLNRYSYALKMYNKLHMPIGVIDSSVGSVCSAPDCL